MVGGVGWVGGWGGCVGDFNVYSRPNLNWVFGPKTWVGVRARPGSECGLELGPEPDNKCKKVLLSSR